MQNQLDRVAPTPTSSKQGTFVQPINTSSESLSLIRRYTKEPLTAPLQFLVVASVSASSTTRTTDTARASTSAHKFKVNSPQAMSGVSVDRSSSSREKTRGSLSRGDDWEHVRPIIERLYVDENKTLKEVMELLSRDHGHRGR